MDSDMRSWIASVFFIMTLLTGTRGQQAVDLGTDNGIRLVMGILSKSGASGSLAFNGVCFHDFPSTQIPTSFDAPAENLLRETFSEDLMMQVYQDASGIIRMAQTDVDRSILDVKIRHVSFTRPQGSDGPIYDPTEAMRAILQSPEAVHFSHMHNLRFPAIAVHLPHAPLNSESPHISGSLNDVTVSEGLDRILKAFPGLWVYESCPGAVEFFFFSNSTGWVYDMPRKHP